MVYDAQICNQCETFAQQVCDNCQGIKEIELQIVFKLDKLWGISEDADKMQLKVNKLDESTTGENVSDGTQIYQLRNFLKHNVKAHQNIRKTKSFGRICLLPKTFDNVMTELENVQGKKYSRFIFYNCVKGFSKFWNLSD